MCVFFQVSRSAYYAWQPASGWETKLDPRCSLIQEAWLKSRKTYGYRRIGLAIRRTYGQVINHKAILRLMRMMNIRSVARKRNPHKATGQAVYVYPNKLKRRFSAPGPNQKWVSDITYIPTTNGFVYLSIFKDLFDGFLVGYHLARENSVSLVIQALRKALVGQFAAPGLIVHSDQGHQYSTGAYREQLRKYRLQPSMSRQGNALDNAPAESFFSHLKEEALRHHVFSSLEEVQPIVDDYIHFYNYERIQLKTKLTPFELRRQFV